MGNPRQNRLTAFGEIIGPVSLRESCSRCLSVPQVYVFDCFEAPVDTLVFVVDIVSRVPAADPFFNASHNPTRLQTQRTVSPSHIPGYPADPPQWPTWKKSISMVKFPGMVAVTWLTLPEVLSISKGASKAEIKKAYHKVRPHHFVCYAGRRA